MPLLEKVLIRQLKGSLFHIPIMLYLFLFLYIHIDSTVATTLFCGVSL